MSARHKIKIPITLMILNIFAGDIEETSRFTYLYNTKLDVIFLGNIFYSGQTLIILIPSFSRVIIGWLSIRKLKEKLEPRFDLKFKSQLN